MVDNQSSGPLKEVPSLARPLVVYREDPLNVIFKSVEKLVRQRLEHLEWKVVPDSKATWLQQQLNHRTTVPETALHGGKMSFHKWFHRSTSTSLGGSKV